MGTNKTKPLLIDQQRLLLATGPADLEIGQARMAILEKGSAKCSWRIKVLSLWELNIAKVIANHQVLSPMFTIRLRQIQYKVRVSEVV